MSPAQPDHAANTRGPMTYSASTSSLKKSTRRPLVSGIREGTAATDRLHTPPSAAAMQPRSREFTTGNTLAEPGAAHSTRYTYR